MKTISGLFTSREEAERAVGALEDAGIAGDDISLVAPGGGRDDNDTAEGAGVGAAVGGAGGLLAGLGAFAISGNRSGRGSWLACDHAGRGGGRRHHWRAPRISNRCRYR